MTYLEKLEAKSQRGPIRLWAVLLAVFMILGHFRTASAQYLQPTFRSDTLRPPQAQFVVLWSSDSRIVYADAVTKAHDHWREGAIAGAVVGGVSGAAFARGFCESGRHCLGRTLGGAIVGALAGMGVGALIGSLFPKP